MTETLTVQAFVAKLVSLFPMSNKNEQAWMERYTSVLNEIGSIDFKRLWKIFDSEYMSTVTPPSSKWLKEAAQRAKIGAQTGDIKAYQTITCIINGGIYEFAYRPGLDDKAIEKTIAKSSFHWFGDRYSAPKEAKKIIEKLQDDFLSEWGKKR